MIASDLNNHLCDALAAKSLAANKGLALDASEEVADGSQREEDTGSDKAGSIDDRAKELDDGHDGVGGGAEVVGRDLADEAIELAGGRADAEEQGNLDKEDEKGGGTVRTGFD